MLRGLGRAQPRPARLLRSRHLLLLLEAHLAFRECAAACRSPAWAYQACAEPGGCVVGGGEHAGWQTPKPQTAAELATAPNFPKEMSPLHSANCCNQLFCSRSKVCHRVKPGRIIRTQAPSFTGVVVAFIRTATGHTIQLTQVGSTTLRASAAGLSRPTEGGSRRRGGCRAAASCTRSRRKCRTTPSTRRSRPPRWNSSRRAELERLLFSITQCAAQALRNT